MGRCPTENKRYFFPARPRLVFCIYLCLILFNLDTTQGLLSLLFPLPRKANCTILMKSLSSFFHFRVEWCSKQQTKCIFQTSNQNQTETKDRFSNLFSSQKTGETRKASHSYCFKRLLLLFTVKNIYKTITTIIVITYKSQIIKI